MKQALCAVGKRAGNPAGGGVDCLMQCLAPARHLAVTVAIVTESAKTLERKHLSGPAAGRALGECLACAAVMSDNLGGADERVCAQFQCDGPLGGCVVDAGFDGMLRGYTHMKTLDAFDGQAEVDLGAVFGKNGRMVVVQSSSEKILYQGIVRTDPPSARLALAKYFNESLQRPSAAEIVSASKDFRLDCALAVLAEKMPDASSEDFLPLLEAFNDGSVRARMAGAFSWESLRGLPGLEDLQVKSVRELRFGCRCSYERLCDSLAALSPEDLREIVAAGQGQEANCHFCGCDYHIRHEDIVKLLEK